MKRDYGRLDFVYLQRTQADRKRIERVLPKRGRFYGGTIGELNTLAAYDFEPPLTLREMTGLLRRLFALGAKKITFQDTLSLGRSTD